MTRRAYSGYFCDLDDAALAAGLTDRDLELMDDAVLAAGLTDRYLEQMVSLA